MVDYSGGYFIYLSKTGGLSSISGEGLVDIYDHDPVRARTLAHLHIIHRSKKNFWHTHRDSMGWS